jgi:hypothetical protein
LGTSWNDYKRELLEETALATAQLELLSIATANGEYNNQGESHQFHQIGIIYKVSNINLMYVLKKSWQRK